MRRLWSHRLGGPPRGLALAREPGTLLLWDAQGRLLLRDRAGAAVTEVVLPAVPAAVACSDDGRSILVGQPTGSLLLLGPDLRPRWERGLPSRVVAVALDPLGTRLAATDGGGGLHLIDADGRAQWTASTPRPLHFLSFVPEQPTLVGCADHGLVACFDALGRCVWRDGLVANVGGMAVSGNGGLLVLACYTEGLIGYRKLSPKRERLGGTACRLAAISYTGEVLLTTGLEKELVVRDAGGSARKEMVLEGTPVGVALSALGDSAVVALGEGEVMGLAVG